MEKVFSLRYQEIAGVGPIEAGSWGRTLVHEPTEKRLLSLRGKLFIVSTISGPKSFDVTLAGKLVLDTIHDEYYSLLEGSPLFALEKAVLAAHRRLVDLTYNTSAGEGIDFNLVAASLWGNVLYLAKLGTAAVYLLRAGEIRVVSPAEENQVAVASGLIEGGDVIIFGSANFRKCLPPEVLKDNLDRLDEKIAALPDSRNLLGLVIRLDLKEVVAGGELIQFAYPAKTVLRNGFSSFRELLSRIIKWPLSKFRSRRDPSVSFSPPVLSEHLPIRLKLNKPRIGQRQVIFLLALFFLGSVGLTFRKQKAAQRQREITEIIQQSEDNLRSAEELIEINNERARLKLKETEVNTTRLNVLGAKTEALEIQNNLNRIRSTLDKSFTVNPVLLYDLSIQNRESAPVGFTAAESALFIADPGVGAIYKLRLSDPAQLEVFDDGQTKFPRWLALYENYLYGLDSLGLFRFALKDNTFAGELSVAPAASTIIDFKIYLGNVYLLTENGHLLKISPTADGFSEGVNWLKEETDLTGVSSFAVDGSIYLSFSAGQIRKFTLGYEEDFSLIGLPEPLGNRIKVYTTENLNYLYLLDEEKKKITVVSKGGLYQYQLILPADIALEGNAALSVDSGEKAVYLLSGRKAYKLDINKNL